ncbi:MAG: DUF433 domain-containing protein [Chloroflexi bacterium]|nr:DUF433 domain-containing protein [Chloroflexota bacterium]
MADVVRDHIEILTGAGRVKPRIAGHRIRVQGVVVWHEKLGMSPDETVHEYPTITLADVYAALAYYWDHRDQVEQLIAEERTFVDELRWGRAGPLEEKLKRLRRG